jgi:hypothetical protein
MHRIEGAILKHALFAVVHLQLCIKEWPAANKLLCIIAWQNCPHFIEGWTISHK